MLFFYRIVKIIMWRSIHPLARFDWYFHLTLNYKKSKNFIENCDKFLQGIISNTKKNIAYQNISLENAKSYIQHLCCDSEKRPAPLTNKTIQNEVQSIIFAVSEL